MEINFIRTFHKLHCFDRHYDRFYLGNEGMSIMKVIYVMTSFYLTRQHTIGNVTSGVIKFACN